MYISIDIGGTNIRIAKCKDLSLKIPEYEILYKDKLTHDYDIDLKNLIDILKKEGKFEAIAIGIAGRINLPKWQNKDYVSILKNLFNCKVFVDTDASMAGYGYAYYGSIKLDEFLYLTWGTGIGAVIINNGRELTCTKLDYDKYRKGFEDKCGGKNLEKKYGRSLSELNGSEWNYIFKDIENEIIKLSNMFTDIPIVIGGGATSRQVKRFEELSYKLKEQDIDLIVSELGDDIGLLGGFAYIFYCNNPFS